MAFADGQALALIKEATLRCFVTLAGTVTRGDVLGYSGGWVRALATVGSTVQGTLVALEDGVSGDVIQAARGVVMADRLTGMTPGGVLYVAEGSLNGQYTETKPSTTNDVTTPVGFSLSATEAVIWPESGARTLSA